MTSLIPGRTAEYRKRLSDPNKRKTIPNDYLKALNPAMYATRQTNATNAKRTTQNNALYDPTRMLSGSEIYSLAKAQAGGAYDPLISDATTQRKLAIVNDAALAERTAGYNQMASSALAATHEAAQTGQQQLATQLAGTRTGTLGGMDQDQAKEQQASTADATLRGSDVNNGLSQRLASDFQQQRAGVAANLSAQENQGNTNASGWTSLIGMMQGAQTMRGADQASSIAVANTNREAGLQSDIDKLKTAKLTDPTNGLEANVNRLRQSEFEKGAAIQTLDLKGQAQQLDAQKAQADQAYKTATLKANNAYKSATIKLRELTLQQAHGDRSASLRERIREANANQRNAASRLTLAQNKEARLAEQQGKDAKTGTVNGVKLQTPLAQSKVATTISHAVNGILPSLKSGKGIENPNFDDSKDESSQNKKWLFAPKKGGYSRAEAANILSSDSNAPSPAAISAALDVAYLGYISPGTAAKLHREGIAVKNLPYRSRIANGASNYPTKGGSGAGQ